MGPAARIGRQTSSPPSTPPASPSWNARASGSPSPSTATSPWSGSGWSP